MAAAAAVGGGLVVGAKLRWVLGGILPAAAAAAATNHECPLPGPSKPASPGDMVSAVIEVWSSVH